MRVLLILLIAGVAEISVLAALGNAIGALPTIGLLLAAAALGVWLLRREGRRTLREFTEAARMRRPADKEISDGMLLAAAGVLIVVPGFISGLAGLLLLLPPVRAVVRKRMIAAAERRSERMQDDLWLHQQRMRGQAGRPGDFIDGEVVTVDEDPPAPGVGPTILPPRSVQAERLDEPPRH
ncbi:FxsA family protein [Saccharopolyspora griseoalba]|uniref:FxsA family protein n=1 Tax=Saccharopolyspora griseoalba TaxID=1431848 RepID=A0ABW2LN00_9PSEU